jgi:hypothetical protein
MIIVIGVSVNSEEKVFIVGYGRFWKWTEGEAARENFD